MAPLNHLLFFLISILTPPITFSQNLLQVVATKEPGKHGLRCDSWRLSVETNNAGSWDTVPSKCAGFVADYMNGERYSSDSRVVAGEALHFAKTVPIAGDGKDVWVFDIDETLLSNLPYYAANGYGSEEFNETSSDEWVNLAKAPALPASLKLYKELQELGFQLVLITGRTEDQRAITVKNLLFARYHSWKRLILRSFRHFLPLGFSNVSPSSGLQKLFPWGSL